MFVSFVALLDQSWGKDAIKKGDLLWNKQQLIAAAAATSGLTKKWTQKALKVLTGAIVAEVAKKGKVQLIGFGTFEARSRKARTGKNPQTGAT